jgi:hypothetical protein
LHKCIHIPRRQNQFNLKESKAAGKKNPLLQIANTDVL